MKRIFYMIFLASILFCGCFSGGDDKKGPGGSSEHANNGPGVVFTVPDNDSKNSGIDSALSVTFDRDMDKSSITSSSFILLNGTEPLSGNVDYDEESRTATFTPNKKLNYFSTYCAIVKSTVKDTDGNPLNSDYEFNFLTENIVASISPSDNQKEVKPDVKIEIIFAAEMNDASVTSNNVLLKKTEDEAAVSCCCVKISEKKWCVTPDVSLQYFTDYDIVIKKEVEDSSGCKLSNDYTLSFKTKGLLKSSSPVDCEENVPVDKKIVISFDAKMTDSSLNGDTLLLLDKTGKKIEGDIGYSAEKMEVSFTPQTPLAYNTDYTFTIKSEVKDENDNNFGYDHIIKFRTVKLVTGILPVNDSGVVPLDQKIEVKFFQPVTLKNNIVVVKNANSGELLSGKISFGNDSRHVVFEPDNNFDYCTKYSIIVAADVAGAENYESEFTTMREPYSVSEVKVFSSYESRWVFSGAEIDFTTDENEADIYTGYSNDPYATEPESWIKESLFTFPEGGTTENPVVVKLFARLEKNGTISGDVYSFTYNVVESGQFPPVGNSIGSEGVNFGVTSFEGWADGCLSFIKGLDRGSCNDESGWNNPEMAFGEATGKNFDIVCLGNHGEIILSFSCGITDGEGFDFGVFENGFVSAGEAGVGVQMFAELAFVEVSSDGEHFIRFDSASLTPSAVGCYGTINVQDVYGLAGVQPNSSKNGQVYGTPFDLSWLRNKREVVNGLVDINNIRYVKIVDISGAYEDVDADKDGENEYYRCYDSFGNIIHDAYKTWGAGGFDLEAIGVIHSGILKD